MAVAIHKQLVRMLRGELPETAAAELRARLERDLELQATYRRLQGRWHALGLPEPAPAPPGFAGRVVARARSSAAQTLAPAWWRATAAGRVATAVILAGGMVAGVLLARFWEQDDWAGYLASEPSLVESYWAALEQSGFQPAEETRP